ncbi:energy-coupling factor transporter transmembrane component T [Desulfitobacterium sp.]|uniref:energy-coupling factor transporter transmembrane component T n=1 Tax=Desulfitobacterium sp. TaxID=49981 RepID=UPI002B217F94|nr:energy-coupling factor transporter transmembrane component T [Desulfitobacterium sp.]
MKYLPIVEVSDMDGLIKFILAILLTILPFWVHNWISIVILSAALVIITLVSKIKPKTLLISAGSYGIIVLIPYLFGFLINTLVYTFSNNMMFANQQGFYESFLRLYRLFIIWYVSILYFHTTPIETVIGMLDQLLTPLKSFGVPIEDYLKVVMCVVIELKSMGTEVKKSLGDSMRTAMGEKGKRFKINLKGISQIIVSLIVDSFGKLDKIESFVEKVNPEELFYYSFNITKRDGLVVLSFMVLTSLVWLVEKGHWV